MDVYIKEQKAAAAADLLLERRQMKFEKLVYKNEREQQLEERKQFQAEQNEVIGKLLIPQLDADMPIVEGTEAEQLSKGAGHFSTTAFPLDNEQILLSGHRDTIFRSFDKLELGHELIIEMPYGTFTYIIEKMEVVDQYDQTVIGPKGEEVLTLSTCYPFRYIGDAPERFIVYAYPKED